MCFSSSSHNHLFAVIAKNSANKNVRLLNQGQLKGNCHTATIVVCRALVVVVYRGLVTLGRDVLAVHVHLVELSALETLKAVDAAAAALADWSDASSRADVSKPERFTKYVATFLSDLSQ
jgi:hypothetical protein